MEIIPNENISSNIRDNNNKNIIKEKINFKKENNNNIINDKSKENKDINNINKNKSNKIIEDDSEIKEKSTEGYNIDTIGQLINISNIYLSEME